MPAYPLVMEIFGALGGIGCALWTLRQQRLAAFHAGLQNPILPGDDPSNLGGLQGGGGGGGGGGGITINTQVSYDDAPAASDPFYGEISGAAGSLFAKGLGKAAKSDLGKKAILASIAGN